MERAVVMFLVDVQCTDGSKLALHSLVSTDV